MTSSSAVQRWAVAAAALSLIGLAGCTGDAEGKSGAKPATTTLVFATNEAADLSGALGVQYFVHRVEELSGGRVALRVKGPWKGGGDEVEVLKGVAAGDADLGWAGTRALDQVGVRELSPLQAPFLVDSYAAQRAVVTDERITETLTKLDSAGLVGLALLADELRIPVGVPRPLRSIDDYQGATLRTVRSDIQSRGFITLGAVPTSNAFDPTMDGAELMWWTYSQGYTGFAHFPTANTPLWPRTVVLVANPESMGRLPVQERAWLTRAARDAAAWSVEHAADQEGSEIAKACAAGAKVVTATDAEVARLKAAVQPLYDDLRSDKRTAGVMAAVEQLVAGAGTDPPQDIPPSCAFQPGDETLANNIPHPMTQPGRTGDLPQGTYRYEFTVDELSARGLDEENAYQNAGVYTWRISGGRWSYQQIPVGADVINTECSGYYDVQGHRVVLSATTVLQSGTCAETRWAATWSFSDHSLVWSDFDIPDLALVFGDKAWRRVG